MFGILHVRNSSVFVSGNCHKIAVTQVYEFFGFTQRRKIHMTITYMDLNSNFSIDIPHYKVNIMHYKECLECEAEYEVDTSKSLS